MPVSPRLVALATILTVGSGCDKAKGLVDGARGASPPEIAPEEALNLATRPQLLFQVFGDNEDLRMIPIAAIEGGQIKRIALASEGWLQLDAMYLRAGRQYPVYQDGRVRGTVKVTQGMWEKPDAPFYNLPGCRALTPLAGVRIHGDIKSSFSIQLLATTMEVKPAPAARPLPGGETAKVARQVTQAEGARSGIDSRSLEGLDFRSVSVSAGATSGPTIIGSYIDPSAADASSPAAQTVHLFVIADRDAADGYSASFTHAVNGPISSAEHRRYYDHLDLTGDGVDEIVLEGWRTGEESFPVILGYSNGRWREIFRGRGSWCLDQRGSS